MRRIILSGVHSVGKSTIAKKLVEYFKTEGFNIRLYSLDNFRIYRLDDVFSSQIDRLYFGATKIKEAEEEQPEIAIFDRSISENIIYSKCFHKFGKLTDDQLTTILRVYQLIEMRKQRLDATILFLNPPIEKLLDNIHARGREKGTILDSDDFIKCLKKMFELHYQCYIDGKVVELTEYDEKTIIKTLQKMDIIQTNYE